MPRIQCALCELYGDEEKMQHCVLSYDSKACYVHLRCFILYKVVAKVIKHTTIK